MDDTPRNKRATESCKWVVRNDRNKREKKKGEEGDREAVAVGVVRSTHRVRSATRAGTLKLLPPPRASRLAERGCANLCLRAGVCHREPSRGTCGSDGATGIVRRGKEGLKGVVKSRHEEERPEVTKVRL